MEKERHLEGLMKKQELIKMYHERLTTLKAERKTMTKNINTVETKLRDLIYEESDPRQLKMFDDIDQFLIVPEKES